MWDTSKPNGQPQRRFDALFELPEPLGDYAPEIQYLLADLSAYSDEEFKRTTELGVSLLMLNISFAVTCAGNSLRS